MKILFINLPYYGHVVPTIGLVKELINAGCEVTYLMPFGWEEIVAESGAAFHGYKNHRQLAEQMKNAYAAAEDIINAYDMVIYEQFFFVGKHLAEKHHKPVARIFTAPATNKELMNEFICTKGPLSIFKHRWIAKAFTKDIARGMSLKTDNWLDEIIENPPELNLVYTLREYQPFVEQFPEEQFKFLGPSVYERKREGKHSKRYESVFLERGKVWNGPDLRWEKEYDDYSLLNGEVWDGPDTVKVFSVDEKLEEEYDILPEEFENINLESVEEWREIKSEYLERIGCASIEEVNEKIVADFGSCYDEVFSNQYNKELYLSIVFGDEQKIKKEIKDANAQGFRALVNIYNYLRGLPKEYRAKFGDCILDAEEKINKIDKTVLGDNHGLITIEEMEGEV